MRKVLMLLATAGLLVSVAPVFAADMGTSATPESDAFSWSGGYLGVVGQYTRGTSLASYTDPTFGPTLNGLAGSLDQNPSGWAGGITLGANQQMDGGIVVGVEGDVEYGNVGVTATDNLAGALAHPGGYSNTVTSKTDWSGTVRGRAGIGFGNIMPYLTAGLAVARASISATDGNISDEATLYGWTAGGGIEAAIDSNWSVKGEVLYTDLGSHVWFAGQRYQTTASSTSTAGRIGINYRF